MKCFQRKCGFMEFGPVRYADGLTLQDEAQSRVASGEWDGIIILLQHTPVISFGNGGGKEHLCATNQQLESQGIEVVSAGRGGNVTCHNPGQLVGYPVLNLEKWQKDVHWYVNMLEEVLILTLAEYGLQTGRKARYSGVWTGDEKIAALGVSVRRWLTGHGFALNIRNNLKLFDSIVPCGISEFGVTSMLKKGFDVELDSVIGTCLRMFSLVFQCELQQMKGLTTLT
ncbi:MAG: lipoyl(octanoyl) transferase LipB [Desulfuromonadales bacterium]